MLQATQLRPGVLIKHDGELYSIFSASHRTPGNKRGFVQTRMRNLRSGAMVDHRFSSEDRVGASHPGRAGDGVPVPGW